MCVVNPNSKRIKQKIGIIRRAERKHSRNFNSEPGIEICLSAKNTTKNNLKILLLVTHTTKQDESRRVWAATE